MNILEIREKAKDLEKNLHGMINKFNEEVGDDVFVESYKYEIYYSEHTFEREHNAKLRVNSGLN
jgi:hypothetical protein